MHVITVGAGLGGLSAALCCLKHGLKVTLLEQATELREVGAGVQISSNGSVILRELGLLEKAAAIGVKPISFRVLRILRMTASYRICLWSGCRGAVWRAISPVSPGRFARCAIQRTSTKCLAFELSSC